MRILKFCILTLAFLLVAFQVPKLPSETDPAAQNPLSSELIGKSCEYVDEAKEGELGLTHLRSADDLSALACLGWQHARDRAWQMEYFRRITRGTSAELSGLQAAETDFIMRLLELPARARMLFAKMSPEEQRPLWAYAWGVNKIFVEAVKNSYEGKHWGLKAEPWHPVDSLALLLLQSFEQTRETFAQELFEQEWLDKKLPAQTRDSFLQDALPWDTSILKAGEFKATFQQTQQERLRITRPQNNSGSNNWVLAPWRTVNGKAILANDPHLDLKHPPFWYWSHLETPSYDVIGAGVPGMPFFASGANRRVAWGITNAYLDAADTVFVDAKELLNLRTERPWIWIRVLGPIKLPYFFKTFQVTEQGWPVIPEDLLTAKHKGKVMVLRSSTFDLEPEDLRGIWRIPYAISSADIDATIASVRVPSWSFVFADVSGSIGYRATGRIPKRQGQQPYGIPERSVGDLADIPLLSADEMPHLLNPKRGYVVTANNRPWPASSSLQAGRAYYPGYRAFRIEELLTSQLQHDLKSISAIQCDVQSVEARTLVPLMLQWLTEQESRNPKIFESSERQAIQAMKTWNYEFKRECTACGAYRRFLDALMKERSMNEAAVYRAFESKAFSKPEEARAIVELFKKAVLDVSTMGRLKSWGDIHQNEFQHLAGAGFFESKFFPTPGDTHTVSPGSHDWDDKKQIYRHSNGASERIVIEMTEPPTVHAVLAGSNRDIPRDSAGFNPVAPGMVWRKWLDCSQDRKAYPFNWAGAAVLRVGL